MLYNINSLTDLIWEWRKIRHATVKKQCYDLWCLNISTWTTVPWKIAPNEIPLGQLTPRLPPPGNLPLDIPPWTTTPRKTSAYKIPPKKITLRTLALWIITPE